MMLVFAMTGRAHCQRQVAYFVIKYIFHGYELLVCVTCFNVPQNTGMKSLTDLTIESRPCTSRVRFAFDVPMSMPLNGNIDMIDGIPGTASQH